MTRPKKLQPAPIRPIRRFYRPLSKSELGPYLSKLEPELGETDLAALRRVEALLDERGMVNRVLLCEGLFAGKPEKMWDQGLRDLRFAIARAAENAGIPGLHFTGDRLRARLRSRACWFNAPKLVSVPTEKLPEAANTLLQAAVHTSFGEAARPKPHPGNFGPAQNPPKPHAHPSHLSMLLELLQRYGGDQAMLDDLLTVNANLNVCRTLRDVADLVGLVRLRRSGATGRRTYAVPGNSAAELAAYIEKHLHIPQGMIQNFQKQFDHPNPLEA